MSGPRLHRFKAEGAAAVRVVQRGQRVHRAVNCHQQLRSGLSLRADGRGRVCVKRGRVRAQGNAQAGGSAGFRACARVRAPVWEGGGGKGGWRGKGRRALAAASRALCRTSAARRSSRPLADSSVSERLSCGYASPAAYRRSATCTNCRGWGSGGRPGSDVLYLRRGRGGVCSRGSLSTSNPNQATSSSPQCH